MHDTLTFPALERVRTLAKRISDKGSHLHFDADLDLLTCSFGAKKILIPVEEVKEIQNTFTVIACLVQDAHSLELSITQGEQGWGSVVEIAANGKTGTKVFERPVIGAMSAWLKAHE